jgi:hypothetical protein
MQAMARSSSKDRLERMALEAAAAADEKKQNAASKKLASSAPRKAPSRSKATSKVSGRLKVVWDVCDPYAKTVRTFPYPEEAAARTEAERLSEETGKSHFVARKQVPFE